MGTETSFERQVVATRLGFRREGKGFGESELYFELRTNAEYLSHVAETIRTVPTQNSQATTGVQTLY